VHRSTSEEGPECRHDAVLFAPGEVRVDGEAEETVVRPVAFREVARREPEVGAHRMVVDRDVVDLDPDPRGVKSIEDPATVVDPDGEEVVAVDGASGGGRREGKWEVAEQVPVAIGQVVPAFDELVQTSEL